MTNYRVKLKGSPKIIQIEAETFEDESNAIDPLEGSLVAKDASGKVTARFDQSQVAGWWIESENTLHVTINNSVVSE
jgi:hypothetical protein